MGLGAALWQELVSGFRQYRDGDDYGAVYPRRRSRGILGLQEPMLAKRRECERTCS